MQVMAIDVQGRYAAVLHVGAGNDWLRGADQPDPIAAARLTTLAPPEGTAAAGRKSGPGGAAESFRALPLRRLLIVSIEVRSRVERFGCVHKVVPAYPAV